MAKRSIESAKFIYSLYTSLSVIDDIGVSKIAKMKLILKYCLAHLLPRINIFVFSSFEFLKKQGRRSVVSCKGTMFKMSYNVATLL
jgi:hypothetical protein